MSEKTSILKGLCWWLHALCMLLVTLRIATGYNALLYGGNHLNETCTWLECMLC